MPRKGENIYKRKDGRWEGRYIKGRNQKGKAIYGYLYAKSYREVKNKMKSVLPHQNESQMETTYINRSSSITFNTLISNWLETRRAHIKESTYIKYRNMIRSYIAPTIGALNVNELTIDCLNSFCLELLYKGGIHNYGLSPKTVSDLMSLIRTVFRYAHAKGIYMPCSAKEIVIKKEPHKFHILSRHEQERLCQYLCSHFSARNMGILLCLYTGLRIGEICALRWEDISFIENTLHVHQTMQRLQIENDNGRKTTVILTAPKSKHSVRVIPLPEDIVSLLKNFFSVKRGYILTGSSDIYVEPRTMQNHFKRVLKEAHIKDTNFHVLRHTFATRCVENGFDIKSLSEILGHASVNITMSQYVHPTLELKRQNMQRLSCPFTVKKSRQ